MEMIFEHNIDIEMRMFYNELLETALENGLENVSKYMLKYGIISAKMDIIIPVDLEYYVMYYAVR